jgi:uncharacterized membrane protein
MDIFLSLITGVCLSATSGFRIFVPFLFISFASLNGDLSLSEGFSWIATYPALIVFSILTIVEIIGYYNPWIDNALDLLTTVLSLFSGVLIVRIFIIDTNPFLAWGISLVLGITAALTVQFLTDKARTLSTYFKSGYGNPIVSTAELFFAILFSVLTIYVNPILSLILLIITITFLYSMVFKERRRQGM